MFFCCCCLFFSQKDACAEQGNGRNRGVVGPSQGHGCQGDDAKQQSTGTWHKSDFNFLFLFFALSFSYKTESILMTNMIMNSGSGIELCVGCQLL